MRWVQIPLKCWEIQKHFLFCNSQVLPLTASALRASQSNMKGQSSRRSMAQHIDISVWMGQHRPLRSHWLSNLVGLMGRERTL